MKKCILFFIILSYSFSHPVSYSIDLHVLYSQKRHEVTIECKSNVRNKCGLHNFYLLNKDGDILLTKRFPFMRQKMIVSCKKKPYKMIFFLRKIPEHTYTVLFE
jgi:hypothetical protein